MHNRKFQRLNLTTYCSLVRDPTNLRMARQSDGWEGLNRCVPLRIFSIEDDINLSVIGTKCDLNIRIILWYILFLVMPKCVPISVLNLTWSTILLALYHTVCIFVHVKYLILAPSKNTYRRKGCI